MTRFKRIAASAACALLLVCPASAQLIGSGHVMGNGTSSPRTPTDTPLSQVLNQSGSGITKAGSTNTLATVNGVIPNGHCRSTDANGNDIDAGGACTVGGGGGTVSSGSAGQYAYYPANGNVVAGTTFPAPIPNASGSAQNTTANCVSGNTTVALGAAIDFANGQGIALEHCGATFTGAQPTGLFVTPSATGAGPTGSTTYAYQVACADANGGVGVAASPFSISNGNATLGTVTQASRLIAWNQLSFTTTCPAVAIWRNTAGTGYHLIGVFQAGAAILDAGFVQVTIPGIPDTPTATALNDRLVTTIASGGGTVSLVLAAPPGNSATGAYVGHDDTAALTTYMASNASLTLPAGTFNVQTLSVPSNVFQVRGVGPNSVLQGWVPGNVISVSSAPAGFDLSFLAIRPMMLGATKGVEFDSSIGCRVHNATISGEYGVLLSGVVGCAVFNNSIGPFLFFGVDSESGSRNEIGPGNSLSGSISGPSTQIISISGEAADNVHDNLLFGPDVFGVDFQHTIDSTMHGNTISNSNHEGFHLSGNSSANTISDNRVYGGSSSVDYCISISDDLVASSNTNQNLVQGNYLSQCGIAAVGVQQSAGAGVSIVENIIKDNVMLSNSDGVASTPDIAVAGAGVSFTFISGNVSLSSSTVTWNVAEQNINGLPNHTQVGTMFGTKGATATTSLTGTGSAVLSAGSTGY
jgi:parallel beta-helix repeat protein